MTSVLVVQPSRRMAERCALLLLLAWLPSLAFAGHWSALAAPLLGGTPAHESHASRESHREHCHADIEECAGTASTSIVAAPLVQPPGRATTETTTAEPIDDERRTPAGRSDAPLTPPPRPTR